MSKNNPRLPKLSEVIIVLTIFFLIMLSSAALFDIPLQLSLLVVWFLFIIFGLYLGHSYNDLQKSIAEGIYLGIEAALVLVVVGGLIATWIAGGIVPTMIYYGLAIINPHIFLLATLIICALTSMSVGTSWGTAGTAGVAMMAIGESFGMPAGLVAGAVISGATVGDKISPLSDTTVLTASLAKIDVMNHVRSMLWVSGPAFVIAGILFTLVGFLYTGNTVDLNIVTNNMHALNEHFNISWYMFIPVIVVIILLILKKPAIPTISFGALLGIIWAWVFQEMDLLSAILASYEGMNMEVGIPFLDELLNAGGIVSMFDVVIFVILALGFGGILQRVGVLNVITDLFAKWVKNSSGRLTVSTIATSFFGNVFGGANYVALITGVQSNAGNYDKLGIKRSVLTRNTEVGGTLTGSMIPWTENGIFYPAILGVGVLSYAPFLWLAFIAIIISIIYGYTGKCIWYHNDKA